jgi:hypothetical protein
VLRALGHIDKKLRLLLALVRRLILIEAAEIVLKPIAPRAPAQRQPKPATPYGFRTLDLLKEKPRMKEDSATWKVSVQLFPHTGKRQRSRHAAFTAARKRHILRALAFRFEALRRVAANPAYYAQRFARFRKLNPPRWLFERFPSRTLAGLDTELLRPAHIVALKVAIDTT